MSFEDNVRNSFMKAKTDIAEIKDQLLTVAEGHEKLMAIIDELKEDIKKNHPIKSTKTNKLKKKAKKKPVNKAKKTKKAKKNKRSVKLEIVN